MLSLADVMKEPKTPEEWRQLHRNMWFSLGDPSREPQPLIVNRAQYDDMIAHGVPADILEVNKPLPTCITSDICE